MLIICVVSAPLSFISAGFARLSILVICEPVDAFLIPGLTRYDGSRLIVSLTK